MLTSEYVAPYTTSDYYTVTDDETGRTFHVSPDDCAHDPREWYADGEGGSELMIYNAARGYSTDEPRGTLARVFARYYDETGDDERALTLTRRCARAYGNDAQRTASIETVTIRGYSQSDWADALIIAPDDTSAHSIVSEYRQYFSGDVWIVIDDQSGDALGGIYADGAEEAVSHYLANI